jgi:hypothetical protein
VKVLVCGGRNYIDIPSVSRILDGLKPTEIIHGGAPGADAIADMWAMANKIPVSMYKAKWEKYGRAAGPRRNQQMLEEAKPDVVVAFPGGKGTADMVRRAKKAGITTIQIEELK